MVMPLHPLPALTTAFIHTKANVSLITCSILLRFCSSATRTMCLKQFWPRMHLCIINLRLRCYLSLSPSLQMLRVWQCHLQHKVGWNLRGVRCNNEQRGLQQLWVALMVVVPHILGSPGWKESVFYFKVQFNKAKCPNLRFTGQCGVQNADTGVRDDITATL